MKRRVDPFKHNSEMTAMATLVRVKADTIDKIADDLMAITKSDHALDRLLKIKTKALEIVDIVQS